MVRMILSNMDNNHQGVVLLISEETIICKQIILIQITKEIINKYKEEHEVEDSEGVVLP
jgi:hypothetical protein